MLAKTVFQKLNNVMGHARARQVVDETLRDLKMSGLDTPDESLRFGNALIAKGGLLASIGRAIKIQAILHGALED